MRKLALLMAFALVAALAAAQEFDTKSEDQLIGLINSERSKVGLEALKPDPHLSEAARQHVVLMADREQLSHQFSGEPTVRERIAATGLRFDSSGENVGFDTRSADWVHDGFMHSTGHRANILSPKYNSVGVGATWSHGALYVAVDFARALDDLSVDQMEDRIAEELHRDGMAREHDPRLRDLACDMAKREDLRPARVLQAVPKARTAFVFTIADPNKLPSEFAKMRASGFRYYSLGACYARSRKYPEGIFWVAAAFH